MFVELSGMEPTAPFTDLQSAAVPLVDLPVESKLAVWYWHVQLLMVVSVEPVTPAVSVMDSETMTVWLCGRAFGELLLAR